MDVSIIVVNFNTEKFLLKCLESVYKTVKNISFEVWLVDNASYDNSVLSAQKNYPDINIVQNKINLGFGAANNLAFKKMKGKYALLLNTDAVLKENALQILYDFMEENKEAGMAGGQLLNTDGSKQNSTAKFPTFLSLIQTNLS